MSACPICGKEFNSLACPHNKRKLPKMMTWTIPIPPEWLEESARDIERIRAAHAPRELSDDEIIEIQFRETLAKMRAHALTLGDRVRR